MKLIKKKLLNLDDLGNRSGFIAYDNYWTSLREKMETNEDEFRESRERAADLWKMNAKEELPDAA